MKKCFEKRLLLFEHLSNFSTKSSTVFLSFLNNEKMIQTFQPWNESCQRFFCLHHTILKIEDDFFEWKDDNTARFFLQLFLSNTKEIKMLPWFKKRAEVVL